MIASIAFVPCANGSVFHSEIMQRGLTLWTHDLFIFSEFVAAADLPALQMFEQKCLGYVKREATGANVSSANLI
jgi:hypothetical protein